MNNFGRLLEHEIPHLRRYARVLARNPAEADDLVQSCLARALAKGHLFEPGTHLRSWLLTVLHNLWVSEVRRAVRESRALAAAGHLRVTQASDDPGALLDFNRAITGLSETQRAVLLLAGLKGMPYEKTAAALEVPIGTVRSRLARVRARLRRLMDEGDEKALPGVAPLLNGPVRIWHLRKHPLSPIRRQRQTAAGSARRGDSAGHGRQKAPIELSQ